LFEPAKISSPFAEVVVALPPNAPALLNCNWPFEPPGESTLAMGSAMPDKLTLSTLDEAIRTSL
jgi:hypothetical protein